MKWLNIIGLTFQFLAFWFAAPELLGATTLKRFEKGLKKFISFLPVFIVLIVILGYGLTSIGVGLFKAYKSQTEGIEEQEMYNYYVALGIGTLCYIVFLVFYKRIRSWLTLKVAEPLTEKLIKNSKIRSTALVIGAVLFTVGFAFQIIALVLT